MEINKLVLERINNDDIATLKSAINITAKDVLERYFFLRSFVYKDNTECDFCFNDKKDSPEINISINFKNGDNNFNDGLTVYNISNYISKLLNKYLEDDRRDRLQNIYSIYVNKEPYLISLDK